MSFLKELNFRNNLFISSVVTINNIDMERKHISYN